MTSKRIEKLELALLLILKLGTLIVTQLIVLPLIQAKNSESEDNPDKEEKLLKNLEIHIFDVPYHVLIVDKGYFCSGSLVTSRSVLTAAHCVNDSKRENILVKVGVGTIIEDGQILKCEEIKIHEYYGLRSPIDNDIALVFLNNHVKFGNNVKKIVLPSEHNKYQADYFNKLIVTSWSRNEIDENNHKLIMTEMKVTPQRDCVRRFGFALTNSMFCGNYIENGCLTDSGNPATASSLLVGIAVLTTNCTLSNDDVVAFTNVTYFSKWVEMNNHRLLSKYCL